ncbi:MAG: heavy metal translocating P-type ATPase [Acidiferrobacterales bacterium]
MSTNPKTPGQVTEESGHHCYHCGLPVPLHTNINIDIKGSARPMCCFGCLAVCQAIQAAGLDDYYQDRQAPANSRLDIVPASLRELRAFDNPQVQQSFVYATQNQLKEASLILEGITCAACVWLNESYLKKLGGIHSVIINYATHRAQIVWDDSQIKLSAILEGINNIGYRAYPYDPQSQEAVFDTEKKTLLKRLGLTAILGMQVMILAVAMYSDVGLVMESGIRTFFRWFSLVLTIPIIIYAADPFTRNALRSIKNMKIGMDVSVSLGLVIAFIASTYATVTGYGHIYFDAIVMFVFFLLSAKYFELNARKHTANRIEAVTQRNPLMATKVNENNTEESLPASDITMGDVLLVRPGEIVPVDGVIIAGQSSLDESLMTGESYPVLRKSGDQIIGGSVNRDHPVKLRVTHVAQETVLATLARLVERAQSEKPAIASLADRIASYFVTIVLLISLVTGAYWWQAAPELAIPVVIAILIVACPCALSLATPTAFSTAMGFLTSRGILLTKGNKFQVLARASHFIFDKTGTLTTGKFKLKKVTTYGKLTETEVLAIASALETGSAHPLASALKNHSDFIATSATGIINHPGLGLSGLVNNTKWFIGSANFINNVCAQTVTGQDDINSESGKNGATKVYLANKENLVAGFHFADDVRDDAADLIKKLVTANKTITLLTGDHTAPAKYVAKQVGINNVISSKTPREKLDYVKALQDKGHVVVMVGDGINDAPVLACADVSIAIGEGAALAAASSDIVLITDKISRIYTAFKLAEKTMLVLKQNLSWALLYNTVAITLAISAVVTPWMAAIGMSASSLIVVLNSIRLRHTTV